MDLSGLKAYYKFNESSGDIINRATEVGSIDGYDSTSDFADAGSLSYSNSGLIDTAIFTGGGSTAHATSEETSRFDVLRRTEQSITINLWINPTLVLADSFIFSNLVFAVGRWRGFALKLNSSSNFNVSLGGNSSTLYINATTSFTVPLGTWSMITIRLELGSNAQTTIDGCEISINNGTPELFNTKSTIVASFGTTTYMYSNAAATNQGILKLDEMSIWDRGLTDNEITAIYNSGVGAELELPPPFSIRSKVIIKKESRVSAMGRDMNDSTVIIKKESRVSGMGRDRNDSTVIKTETRETIL